MVYVALIIRSVAEFASPACYLWTSKTNGEQFETAEIAVAQAISNLVRTTSREVVRMEAHLPSLTQRLRELTLLHADKWSYLQPKDPRHEMITGNVSSRL